MSYKRSRTDFERDRTSSQPRPPFVFYGTPLPPLDSETRDDGSYVPVWQQEVRDERGRKRLHGAFTGGFSAGYFNTVGSKEGWTPSTFVSSRTNRQKEESKRTVEDLMDEEDLADREETQKLQTQSDFSGLGSTQDDGLRRGFVSDIFRDNHDTMGVKLLQRMGWKPGQGLGPRIRRKARDEDSRVDDESKEHLFAPDDVPMISFNKKTDKYGLGWSGEEGLPKSSTSFRKPVGSAESDGSDEESAFLSRKPVGRQPKQKKTSIGVGVLNDTGSDDEDPYAIGPKISYNKTIGVDRKKKKAGLVANASAPKTVVKPSMLSQKLSKRSSNGQFRRCHDGRLPLDGFVLAAQALTLSDTTKYEPPTVPAEWKPKGLEGPTSSEQSLPFQSTAEAAKASSLDPLKRAAMLGESALPGKSIFDYIRPDARDRLASKTGAKLPQGKGEAAPAGFEQTPAERQRSLWDPVPRLDRAIAQAALDRGSTGWTPYAEDEAKRARYRSFLESMTGQRQELPIRLPESSTDEWVSEMREFAQAAMVFKPVSGLMASRFTSAKSSEGPNKASDAPDGQVTRDKLASGVDKAEKPEDPAEQAAKLGMYGPMTRSRVEFYPTRLTCKRFGVKPPAHVLHGPEAGEAQKSRFDVVGKASMDDIMREAATVSTNVRNEPTVEGNTDAPSSAPTAHAEVNIERNDALEGQRPGEELFRAIFGSDDEDD